MAPDAFALPSTANPLALDLRRLPWVRKLAIDYAHNFSSLAPFYAGDPTNPHHWSSAIERARNHDRSRAGIVDVIRAQQARRHAPPQAQAAVEVLRNASSVAVVSGQQAGLFGGPLYTLLKALMAVRLAERAARDHNAPVVPIFWIDSEDHDWDEVGTCQVLDQALTLKRVVLARPPGALDRPVAHVTLDDQVDTAIKELGATLGATEFTSGVLEALSAAYVSGVSMADAFGRWLESTLGPLGLVVFDASDPDAKKLVSHVFARELETAGTSSALAAEAGMELERRGYHAQVTPAAGSVALFYLDEGRRAIQRQDGQFAAGDKRGSGASFVAEAATAPFRFSPNVLLRPIVQDALFPTVCYVAGPSELAYLGQLKGVYAHFGVPMPLIYPRASVTLLDSAAAKFLTKYSVAFEALQSQDERVLNELLAAALPPTIEQTLADTASAIEDRMSAVATAVTELDATLDAAARSTQGRMQHELKALHAKIIQAAKRRDETLRRQFIRARAQAFPEGHPQERAVGFVYFLNRYGSALVDRLHEELPLGVGNHWVMTI